MMENKVEEVLRPIVAIVRVGKPYRLLSLSELATDLSPIIGVTKTDCAKGAQVFVIKAPNSVTGYYHVTFRGELTGPKSLQRIPAILGRALEKLSFVSGIIQISSPYIFWFGALIDLSRICLAVEQDIHQNVGTMPNNTIRVGVSVISGYAGSYMGALAGSAAVGGICISFVGVGMPIVVAAIGTFLGAAAGAVAGAFIFEELGNFMLNLFTNRNENDQEEAAIEQAVEALEVPDEQNFLNAVITCCANLAKSFLATVDALIDTAILAGQAALVTLLFDFALGAIFGKRKKK